MQSDTTFDTGEVKLNVFEGPDSGQPLVLLHGLTLNNNEWGPLLPQIWRRAIPRRPRLPLP